MRIPLAALIAAALAASACASDEDRAAKARIFSPEDPPRVLRAAAETIETGALHTDPAQLDRVFAISAQEAAARLGPHVQEAKVSFRWAAAGKPSVQLSEERMVALGRDGDFHARIDNDERQGMEWVRVDDVSYARSRYAQFRERRRDRGSSEHVVASAYAILSDFGDWVHGALALSHAGETTVDGRKAVKYRVTLGEARDVETFELPEVVYPRGGPDAQTALRLHALENGRPQSASGSLVVDAATGVPLQADLEAALAVPSEQGESRLELSIELAVKKHDGTIAVPEHIEDAPRPPGVVATLEAYGIPRADAKAAAAAERSGEQPPPEDD